MKSNPPREPLSESDAAIDKLIKANPGPVGNALACLHHNLQQARAQAQAELAELRERALAGK